MLLVGRIRSDRVLRFPTPHPAAQLIRALGREPAIRGAGHQGSRLGSAPGAGTYATHKTPGLATPPAIAPTRAGGWQRGCWRCSGP
ncbi:hypothetical protein [Micromonospora echinaurantiaca]